MRLVFLPKRINSYAKSLNPESSNTLNDLISPQIYLTDKPFNFAISLSLNRTRLVNPI